MPVYVCQPGSGAAEPWRHGIQVYAAPFSMDGLTAGTDAAGTVDADNINNNNNNNNNDSSNSNNNNGNDGGGIHGAPRLLPGISGGGATSVHRTPRPVPGISGGGGGGATSMGGSSTASGGGMTLTARSSLIRRIRHAEVVLVDDVCIAFGRQWLRLRWPGHRGGFAGYIALGKINDPVSRGTTENNSTGVSPSLSAHEAIAAAMIASRPAGGNNENNSLPAVNDVSLSATAGQAVEEVREENDEYDNDMEPVDSNKDEEPQDNASTLSAEPLEASSPVTTITCSRTGLIFPSSVAMKLLLMYDDGFVPPVISAPFPSEAVFCRICREGLHDDADDEQPSPAMENDADDSGLRLGRSGSPTDMSDNLNSDDDMNVGDNDGDGTVDAREPMESEPVALILSKGPVLPHPTYHANPHAAENPMLSPCECSGSMAFVHYMCVEQWRCRSRHPEARQGLNCETCGKPYALPPPSARPASVMQPGADEWLEAMPPHVMEALRRPHIWWQIGAAVVRRRWLRPIAPVMMSPVVALYCRARRMLKKRGVARRRWACSLCRRRARWKCVRCLRSYYCSRQCQNVSWHIVHKHVCYKPSRWIWSLIVYGAMTLLAFPGSLRDPLMYDLGLASIPASFYLMAVIGGGFATAMKKGLGMDLRGRPYEVLVVLSTVFLVTICWGLIGGFFGDPSKCHGALRFKGIFSDAASNRVLRVVQTVILKPAQSWFRRWDEIAMSSPPYVRRVLCIPDQKDGCFEHVYKADAGFIFEEGSGGKCASDMMFVTGLVTTALLVGSASYFWKQRERQRRAARRVRPHQD